MLLDNDVHINDIVKVFRSGDVIPYIAEVKPSETYRKKIEINKCPSCGSKVIYKEPELICSNEHCDGSNAKLLFQAVQTLGIDNIGLTTIDKFIEYLDVKDITDILELNEEDLELLPGFGEKLIEKIYTNILTVRNSVIDDYKLLACLNIKGIGNTLSKAILEKCTLNDLLDNIESDKFIEIFGIGENRSDELINGISENYEILDYLMKTFDYTNTKDKDKKTSLGKICFTGKFDCHKSHYYDIAKSKGYEIVESVSKDLLYLVSNGAATSKTSKARKINIKILNLDQFLKL
jgi:DNA ligase (NAD+)